MTGKIKPESKLIDTGGSYILHKQFSGNDETRLTPMFHTIKITDKGNLIEPSLKTISIPKYVTKETKRIAKVIFDEYESRAGTATGAILHGLHGSGKTLTSELVMDKLIKSGVPIIIVNQPIEGSYLLELAKAVGKSAFVFDEFDRTYGTGVPPQIRDSLVSFFSDSGLEDVMFLITTNKVRDLPPVFIDRPGRFLFNIKFTGIDEKFFKEVMLSREPYSAINNKEVIDYCNAFVRKNRPSYDVAKTLLDCAMRCKTSKELSKLLEIYNVPNFSAQHVVDVITGSKSRPSIRIDGRGFTNNLNLISVHKVSDDDIAFNLSFELNMGIGYDVPITTKIIKKFNEINTGDCVTFTFDIPESEIIEALKDKELKNKSFDITDQMLDQARNMGTFHFDIYVG